MNAWNTYSARARAHGGSARSAALQRERQFLNSRIRSSLSYHTALIDGERRELAVIDSDNLNLKTLCSLPGETLRHGALVEWMGYHWLITEIDANCEIYSKAVMQQCNYLLRWISDEGNIIERWCIVSDGTKYLVGEYGDKDLVMLRGDTRISLTITKDQETLKLNRKNRFLIDDYGAPSSQEQIAYELTKPFKLGGSFGKDGVLNFVLQECNTVDSDNFELHIANYYDYFPRKETVLLPETNDGPEENEGKKVWL